MTTSLKDLFSCPISGRMFQEPLIDPCGHVFEKKQIMGWLGRHPFCPLSKRSITSDELQENPLINTAVAVITRVMRESSISSDHGLFWLLISPVERLPVFVAATQIDQVRQRDLAAGVPTRLDPPQFFRSF